MSIILAVLSTRNLTSFIENVASGINFIDVLYALQQSCCSLEPHSSIDVFRRQLAQYGIALFAWTIATNILHENQIPDL